MRNTLKYPPTKKEIIDCLRRLKEESDRRIVTTNMCGDMTSLLLHEAMRIIDQSSVEPTDSELMELMKKDE